MTEAPAVDLHGISLTNEAIAYLCEASGQFIPNAVYGIQTLAGDIARRCEQWALTATELDFILSNRQLSIWLFSTKNDIYCERNLQELERFLEFLRTNPEAQP